MIRIAWLIAVIGGFLVCLLVGMESVGKKLPAWIPFQKYMWWLSFLAFFVSVLSIMLSNI